MPDAQTPSIPPVIVVRVTDPPEGAPEFYVGVCEFTHGPGDITMKFGIVPPGTTTGTSVPTRCKIVMSHLSFEIFANSLAQQAVLVQEMYQEVFGLAKVPNVGNATPEQMDNINAHMKEQFGEQALRILPTVPVTPSPTPVRPPVTMPQIKHPKARER